MNLTEFTRQNDITCNDGEEFSHSLEFFKMKEFKKTSHVIDSVPFVEPETYKVKEFNVMLTSGSTSQTQMLADLQATSMEGTLTSSFCRKDSPELSNEKRFENGIQEVIS